MTEKQKLQKYYADLLIRQYHNKSKAKAEIEAEVGGFVDIMLIANEMSNIFDIDNSSSGNLDLLGKIIGVKRKINDQITLDDTDYRIILKFSIIRMLSSSSIGNIVKLLSSFFGSNICLFAHYNMTMTYWFRNISDVLYSVFELYPDLLPAPAGVGTQIVRGGTTYFGVIFDNQGDYSNPKRAGLIFDNTTQIGETLEDDDVVNN